MSTFKKLIIAVTALFILLTVILNMALIRQADSPTGIYRVEAKRLADDIEERSNYDLGDYTHLTGVFTEEDGDLYISDEQYVIIEARGKLYRVEYNTSDHRSWLLLINGALAVVLLMLFVLFRYIRRNIILPFGRLNDVPQELARGNLAVPIPEEKSRFFGKFTWGVNMLRESIEENRTKEISMQRDKKLLLLSLSHDIKTPLSAIKLNAKALAKGLYKDEQKQREAAESINARADEIEGFVSRITKASSEDFMDFEVHMGEEFLSVILSRINERYAPQLNISSTDFVIDDYDDCILSCDSDRLAECLQNLIENAIKYGDGRLIEICFDTMDGCKLITVKNTGCTLEAKELPQIFESFHRGSNAEKAKGSGLGLFICRKLMTLMGGEAYADIKDECFLVTLVVRLA